MKELKCSLETSQSIHHVHHPVQEGHAEDEPHQRLACCPVPLHPLELNPSHSQELSLA